MKAGFCSVLLGLVFGISACGSGSHGGGGGGNPAPRKDADQSDGEANALTVNVEALTATNGSLQSESGKEPRWTLRVTVNGEEKANLKEAAFGDVSNAVKALTFKRGDVARFEMTVTSKDDAKLILATNVAAVAAADASLKSVWDGQCQASVNPEVKFGDGGLWTASGPGSAQGKVSLTICDFAGVTLKPMIVMKPQAQLLEPKTVIYHCEVKAPAAGTNDVWKYSDTPCGYGYQTQAGETAPTITILKDFAPDAPLYSTHLLVMNRFELNIGPSGEPLLATTFAAPPFGSLQGCYAQKMDVKYGAADGVKSARLSFKRTTDQSGSTVWVPDGATTTWPTLAEITAYYKESSSEVIHFYRVCEWTPEAEDTAAGNVITAL